MRNRVEGVARLLLVALMLVTLTTVALAAPAALNQEESVTEDTIRASFSLKHTGSALTYTVLTLPSHGKLEWCDYANGSTWYDIVAGTPFNYGHAYYTPNAGYSGTDSFTWKCNDGTEDSNTATVSITVTPDTPPVACDQRWVVLKDTESEAKAFFVDPNIDQTVTIEIISQPVHGNLSASYESYNHTCWFRYTPDAGYTGEDLFTWRVYDSKYYSNEATCTILVREVANQSGTKAIIVVNDLLLPEIQAEVNRLKTDLENGGFTTILKPWNTSANGAQDLWNYFVSEHNKPGEWLSGAILIGNIPKATNDETNQYTDRVYMNMHEYRDTERMHIWVSRMHALSSSGGELYFGTEVELLKRVLQANHDYRTGASRYPHLAYYYLGPDFDNNWQEKMNKALEVWPAVEWLRPGDAFNRGSEIINETSHGNALYYNGGINKFNIHDKLALSRFACINSCTSGAFGGVVNQQLLTRGGGNILSIGATAIMYGRCDIFDTDRPDTMVRDLLSKNEPWGTSISLALSLIEPPYGHYDNWSFFDRHRIVFYGDLSIPVMASPHNEMPLISSFNADVTSGAAPLTVNFTTTSSDSDGSIASYEWFLNGHCYGRYDPVYSGAGLANVSHTYTLPHRYLARVEVVDNYKARAHKDIEIKITPNPSQTFRVNCGRIDDDYAYYSEGMDYTDSSGHVWLHDQNYVSGTWGYSGSYIRSTKSSDSVAGTTDDSIYQYYHYNYYSSGSIKYTIPIANGGYTVKLHFADMSTTAAGQRLIDVEVEGSPWLTAFDIVATGGAKTAVTVSTHVDLTDGSLEILLKANTASSKYAIINAFEIIPDGGGGNNPPVAMSQAVVTDEDTAKAITLEATDADNEPLTYIIVSGPSHGTLSGSAPDVIYTPNAGYTGPDSFTFKANDGTDDSNIATVAITVNPSSSNNPPVMTSATITPAPAYTNNNLTATGTATDADSDPITYKYQWKKNGVEIAGATASTLSSSNFLKSDSITVVITPNDGTEDGLPLESAALLISNSAVTLNAIGNKSVNEGQLLSFTISATDPDVLDTLTYSASGLPSGASFDPATQTFTWTPGYDQAGAYPGVHFEVTDGDLEDSEDITITVNNVNRAPVLDPVGDKSVFEEDLLIFTISASDPDVLDTLTYSASGLPAGASFIPATRTFTWTPDDTQAGNYNVTFSVSDGNGGNDSETITITVEDTGVTPGAIAGRVIDADTGLPVQGVKVSDGTRSTTTDANGEYTIAAVPPGIYSLTFTKTGYEPDSLSGVVVTEGNTTILPDFQLQEDLIPTEYALSINISGSGIVTKNPDKALYGDGEVVTLIPAPDAGWTFGHWEGNLSGSDNPAAITMDADKTVTAVFTRRYIPLPKKGGGCSISSFSDSTPQPGTVLGYFLPFLLLMLYTVLVKRRRSRVLFQSDR